MPKNHLDASDAGIDAIIGHEDQIDGLYDDSSGYGTFGVGHLVHQSHKWESFLLEAAREDPSLKSLIREKVYSKHHKLLYLPRGAAASPKYGELADRAVAKAREVIARKLYKKDFAQLKLDEQQKVQARAKEAIDEEKRLLTLNVRDTFKHDLKPFVKAVNHYVTGVELGQDEFDALVSFAFNVGTHNLHASTLLKKINLGKYRAGASAKDRKAAMDGIRAEFLKWNKSGGKVVSGLTKRRQAEADLFLEQAEKEYEELVRKARAIPAPAGAPLL